MAFNPKLVYQVSPIWLTGPPVQNMPNGMLPIIALTDPALFQQVASGGPINIGVGGSTTPSNVPDPISLDDAFGAFQVAPGGSLIKTEIAQYPFANQQVAGNAMIFQPLQISLLWDTPMRGANAWTNRMSIIGLLQAWLYYHNNNGGTFTVVTPSYIYTNMLLTGLIDSSRGTNPVPQNCWKFDFERPLISLADLTAAQSNLMSKISSGVQTNGLWTGVTNALTQPLTLPQFTVPGTVP